MDDLAITLSEALRFDRLDEFIAQEEARGVGPADTTRLNRALSQLIKEPRQEDQTSRSPSNDCSSETKIR